MNKAHALWRTAAESAALLSAICALPFDAVPTRRGKIAYEYFVDRPPLLKSDTMFLRIILN